VGQPWTLKYSRVARNPTQQDYRGSSAGDSASTEPYRRIVLFLSTYPPVSERQHGIHPESALEKLTLEKSPLK
jgi:hypothetical protein